MGCIINDQVECDSTRKARSSVISKIRRAAIVKKLNDNVPDDITE